MSTTDRGQEQEHEHDQRHLTTVRRTTDARIPKMDRWMLLASYLILIMVMVWTTYHFTDIVTQNRAQRCTADLLAADLQLQTADYVIDVLSDSNPATWPPDETEALRRDELQDKRDQLADACAELVSAAKP